MKNNENISENLISVATDLDSYTRNHFSDEEALYKEHGIDIEDHVNQHLNFVMQIKQAKEVLLASDGIVDVMNLLEIYRGLLSWFMNHIKVDDKNMWLQKTQ